MSNQTYSVLLCARKPRASASWEEGVCRPREKIEILQYGDTVKCRVTACDPKNVTLLWIAVFRTGPAVGRLPQITPLKKARLELHDPVCTSGRTRKEKSN